MYGSKVNTTVISFLLWPRALPERLESSSNLYCKLSASSPAMQPFELYSSQVSSE